MYNITNEVSSEFYLASLKKIIPKNIYKKISNIETISVLNWKPEYFEIIKGKNHEKMLEIIKEKYQSTDVRNDLLEVLRLNIKNELPMILYVFSPIELYQNNSLILIDDYPKTW